MVFTPPSWVPEAPSNLPDDISVSQFMLNEKYGRQSFKSSRNPFTCGISGKSYTVSQQAQRVELLARTLSKELGWQPNTGTEWEKVMGIFSLNTIDFMTLAYAVHELGGVVSPANAQYSAAELEFQLKSSQSKALFTCIPLLETALQAAQGAGIPNDRIFILDLPKEITGGKKVPFKTADDLIAAGEKLPKLGAIQDAEGTSSDANSVFVLLKWNLWLTERSHDQSPKFIAQGTTYRGDEIIILPKFELKSFLKSIQDYRVQTLYVVPPIIIQMVNNQSLCSKYDIRSVRSLFTGAAPLGTETAEDLQKIYPKWAIRQGYGLTETSTVVCVSSVKDIWLGSCGSLIPGVRAKLLNPEGVEVTALNEPGELVVQSKSVVLGYLNNPKANEETFIADTDGNGRWMRTGDEAEIRKSPLGNEHIFIVDRIKETYQSQVAPAELEAHLLAHPLVADCAVIPIPDDAAGEIPKAYVVKSQSAGTEDDDSKVKREISKWVESHKARHKWLKGGVEFIDVIPKSPSGKILRRL
ncbi:hypothetical protein EYC84_008077 [Monilinia fructicola]|uniref:AMP-dependent synthetase/ligase domain-containing protein n=1 Tax=Monilinia fructicola TaxID=38448 RepID=A0A5M9JIF8_MONFR|nr:hypothetical protein EYC84_008077 [Monilinia fructicola]